MHQNTPHFKLLENNQIEMNSLFENYMKLIGCGIAAEDTDFNNDPKSIFETPDN